MIVITEGVCTEIPRASVQEVEGECGPLREPEVPGVTVTVVVATEMVLRTVS